MAAVASSRSSRFNNFFGPVQPLSSSSSSSTSSRFYSSSSSSSSKAFASSSSQLSSSSTAFGSSSSSHVIRTSTNMKNNKKTCMCSPTNHPGSFRCSLHKNNNNNNDNRNNQRLNARRSAMTNSLVRIGTVEGDLVKRALAALIRPSSHHQKRRSAFQPRRPSRLSIMSY